MLLSIFSFFVWIFLWYAVFYFRYKDAKIIDEMRNNLFISQQNNNNLEIELKELNNQNKILKHKGQFLLDQNDDYSKIISELSRIIHLIKKASLQIKELDKTLSGFDPSIEDKYMKLWEKISQENNTPFVVPVYEKRFGITK